MKEFTIDGNQFSTLSDFFDTIGFLLVNGSWGHNLDALNDILVGGFGITEHEEPFKLIWLNANISRSQLNDFNLILEIIKEHENVSLELR